MIKKLIFLSLILVTMGGVATAQQTPFAITGNIKGKTDGYIFLSYQEKGYDSSKIENGQFSFKGSLSSPVQAMVMMDRNARFFDKYVRLYVTPGNLQLSLDYNNFSDGAVLKGSPVQEEADQLNKMEAPVMAKIRPLSEAYNKANGIYIAAMKEKKDEATLDALKEKANEAKDAMDPYYKQIGDIDKEFMDNHPASYVTASLLRYRISGMPLQEGEERYGNLPDDIKSSGLGKEIKETLDGLRRGSPGAKAYVFSSTELRGQSLSLADYKGKYVVVDFWASWCVPCRAGNPHLLSLYSKYKNKGKGLEIIGVSDDDSNPQAWKKAVEKDGIGVWKHVLRGLKTLPGYKFDRSADLLSFYGINSLPTKILIDPNGMIIGRYGDGGENEEAMDKKFTEIFGS